jgi:hypothetical protein
LTNIMNFIAYSYDFPSRGLGFGSCSMNRSP